MGVILSFLVIILKKIETSKVNFNNIICLRTRDQIANICWIIKKAREFQKKTSTSALLTMPKPLTVWITTIVENSERDGNTRPPDLPPEKPICRSGSNN